MPGQFNVTILRQYSPGICTSGYLDINGSIICYTLERPWIDNINNISSIPAGSYAATLRYDHADHWRMELVGVPDRSSVQIHIGNQPDQTQGCILVGRGLGAELCSLTDSAGAYADLKAAFYGSDTPNSTPDVTITVTLTG